MIENLIERDPNHSLTSRLMSGPATITSLPLNSHICLANDSDLGGSLHSNLSRSSSHPSHPTQILQQTGHFHPSNVHPSPTSDPSHLSNLSNQGTRHPPNRARSSHSLNEILISNPIGPHHQLQGPLLARRQMTGRSQLTMSPCPNASPETQLLFNGVDPSHNPTQVTTILPPAPTGMQPMVYQPTMALPNQLPGTFSSFGNYAIDVPFFTGQDFQWLFDGTLDDVWIQQHHNQAIYYPGQTDPTADFASGSGLASIYDHQPVQGSWNLPQDPVPNVGQHAKLSRPEHRHPHEISPDPKHLTTRPPDAEKRSSSLMCSDDIYVSHGV